MPNLKNFNGVGGEAIPCYIIYPQKIETSFGVTLSNRYLYCNIILHLWSYLLSSSLWFDLLMLSPLCWLA